MVLTCPKTIELENLAKKMPILSRKFRAGTTAKFRFIDPVNERCACIRPYRQIFGFRFDLFGCVNKGLSATVSIRGETQFHFKTKMIDVNQKLQDISLV